MIDLAARTIARGYLSSGDDRKPSRVERNNPHDIRHAYPKRRRKWTAGHGIDRLSLNRFLTTQGCSAPENAPSRMPFSENHSGKLVKPPNPFVDCHSHLPKYQSGQAFTRSSHKLDNSMRMQLIESRTDTCESLIDWDHQRWENKQRRETSSTDLCASGEFGYKTRSNPRALIKSNSIQFYALPQAAWSKKSPLACQATFGSKQNVGIEEKLRKYAQGQHETIGRKFRNTSPNYRLTPENIRPGDCAKRHFLPQPSFDATEQYLHEFGE